MAITGGRFAGVVHRRRRHPPITLRPEEPARVLHDRLVGLQGGSPATFIDLPLSGAVIECGGLPRLEPVGYTLSVENGRILIVKY